MYKNALNRVDMRGTIGSAEGRHQRNRVVEDLAASCDASSFERVGESAQLLSGNAGLSRCMRRVRAPLLRHAAERRSIVQREMRQEQIEECGRAEDERASRAGIEGGGGRGAR